MSDEVNFSNLTILETRRETSELEHLRVGAPEAYRAAYLTPGQYVQVRIEGHKPGFYAIANAPGAADLELLVKRGSPVSDAIVAKKTGDILEASLPMGRGYPFDQALGRDVFAIGVGSGITPLRALIQAVLKERSRYGRVRFVYGARTACAFPYESEIGSWPAHGLEVTRICSRPAENTWRGPVGRVQDVLLAEKDAPAPGGVAYVCGMKSMVADVKAALAKLGLPEDRVYQNF